MTVSSCTPLYTVIHGLIFLSIRCTATPIPCHNYHGGACYKVVDTAVGRSAARQRCQEDWKGDLVVINYPAEHAHVWNLISRDTNGGDVWLGISRDKVTGNWVTVNGKTQTYFNWTPGQPDGARSGFCGQIFGTSHATQAGKWDDLPCASYTRRYVCKYYPSKETCRDVKPGLPKCYIPVNELATWGEGRQICADRYGGDLAYIGNWNTENQVKTLVSRDLTAFYQYYSASHWSWVGLKVSSKTQDDLLKVDGKAMADTYRYWNSGEPNGQLSDCLCIRINDGRWNDGACDTALSFVCEYIPDINECVEGTHKCEQICVNEPGIGAYSCQCNDTFQLGNDGYSCKEIIYEGCFVADNGQRILPHSNISSDNMTRETCIEHCYKTGFQCPTGWEEFNDYCYYASAVRANYLNARARCELLDSHIVKKNTVLSLKLSVISTFWIGLTDLETEGIFKWDDGTPFTMDISWNNNEPNNMRNEDCTGHAGGANDFNCGTSLSYICKRAKEQQRNVGCYVDDPEHTFPTDDEIVDLVGMTLSKCFIHCRGLDRRYAALQTGSTCRCGSEEVDLGIYSIAPDAECNAPCTGASFQMCGGTSRNSVYDLLGLPLAGVHSGRECHCGTYKSDITKHGAVKSESECNLECAGNPQQKCGAPLRMNIFQVEYTDECAKKIADCHQICTDTIKGYKCSCDRRYMMTEDQKTCSTCASFHTDALAVPKYRYIDQLVSSEVTKVEFACKASSDFHVSLASGNSGDVQLYEIVIGGWGNTKSVIRTCAFCHSHVVEAQTASYLTSSEYREFYITFENGLIEVGRSGQMPFMTHQFENPHPINYIGISTYVGKSGDWKVCFIYSSEVYSSLNIPPNQRHKDVLETTSADSVIRCASFCKANRSCSGFSFNKSLKLCELIAKSNAFDLTKLVYALGYTYHRIK